MTDLLPLLEEFYRDKQTAMLRHMAGARLVAQYDINNTYQYVIAREDVELSWVATAIRELGGKPAEQAEADRGADHGQGPAAARAIIEEDARAAKAFVDRWSPRVETIAHARHRGMLRVILGEVAEQQRFFEQARAGRTDLLGRRGPQLGPSHGSVLSERWIE